MKYEEMNYRQKKVADKIIKMSKCRNIPIIDNWTIENVKNVMKLINNICPFCKKHV